MYDGTWGGTMCLTEPHAGSDVGSARTSAKKNADGSYSIVGTKIFISGGDHDLAENIVHLVLARVDGAPAGTKGLTLFIVPKVRASQDGTLGETNDVSVGEHRAQDGHQRLVHLRPELRRERQVHRLARRRRRRSSTRA